MKIHQLQLRHEEEPSFKPPTFNGLAPHDRRTLRGADIHSKASSLPSVCKASLRVILLILGSLRFVMRRQYLGYIGSGSNRRPDSAYEFQPWRFKFVALFWTLNACTASISKNQWTIADRFLRPSSPDGRILRAFDAQDTRQCLQTYRRAWFKNRYRAVLGSTHYSAVYRVEVSAAASRCLEGHRTVI